MEPEGYVGAILLGDAIVLRQTGQGRTLGTTGRPPGLDAGTLGGRQGSPLPTTEVHLRWSKTCERPPRSAQAHLEMLLRLRAWRHIEVGAKTGAVLSSGPTAASAQALRP